MAQGDGSILITVDLNAKEAEQELSRLKKGILRMEEDLLLSKTQESNLEKMLKNARDRVEELKASGSPTPWLEQIPNLEKQIASWEKELSSVRGEIETTANDIESTKILYAELELATAKVREEEEKRVAAAAKAREEAKAAAEQAKEQDRIARERAHERVKEVMRATEEMSSPEVAQLNEELEHLQAQLKFLENYGIGLGYKEYDDATKRVAEINDQLREYKKNLTDGNKELEKMPENVEEVAEGTRQLSPAMQAATSRLEKFENRIKGLVRRVFVFSLITMALRNMRTWLSNAVKSNDEAAAAIARLKGALLTMAQPILQVVIPAFITLVNVLTRVVTAVASLFSKLSGKTLQQSADAAKSLYDEQNAIKGVGSAAKKASKSLASFDEINKLTTEDAGAGGAASTEIAPVFDMGEVDESFLNTVLGYVEAIGAALAGWAIGKALKLDLVQTLGLMMAIYGAIQFVKTIMDMWTNGVNFDNLLQALEALLMVAVGLGIAFGPVAAGIALVVGGAALLITAIKDILKNGLNLENGLMAIIGLLAVCAGIALKVGAGFGVVAAGAAVIALGLVALVKGFQDAIENGWNLENTLTALAGIILTGLGISVLTGSWIPLLIAGILGVLVAITTLTGNGGKLIEGLKQIFQGLNEFISGVFTGDWDKAWNGVKDIFKGVWNTIVTLLESAVNLIIKGVNWLISQINKISFTVPNWVPEVGGKSIGINIPSVREIQIPRLAQGAVIPPNREFMAVLGDQTSGRNIEAPEGLIREIVASEMNPLVGLLQQLIEVEREGKVLQVADTPFARVVRQYGNAENARIGGSLVSVRSGV